MKEDFHTLIEANSGILYKIGRAYTQNEVDFSDLYQEMLIQLWQSLRNFKGASKSSTWLYKVALNTALTYHKKQKRLRIFESLDTQLLQLKEEQTSRTEDKKIEMLYECINQLPKERRALVLLQLDGKEYKEIAEIMGIQASNVGVLLMRSKKQLKDLLIENGYGQL